MPLAMLAGSCTMIQQAEGQKVLDEPTYNWSLTK